MTSKEEKPKSRLSYVARIKYYEYTLHCGLVFSTHTPSVADETGKHNFPCRRCITWHSYVVGEIPGLRLAPATTRDMEYVTRLDKAVKKDRIVSDLFSEWDRTSYKKLAGKHGVSDDTVYRIAAELGVPDSAEGHGNVHVSA